MIDLSEIGSVVSGRAQTMLLQAVAIVFACLAFAAGIEWWIAAHDRDTAREALKAEQGVSASLRASIAIQNSAVDAMQAATAQADARGLAAQQMAASAGRRYDAALAKLGTARAITCAEAMPVVNQLLEDVR